LYQSRENERDCDIIKIMLSIVNYVIRDDRVIDKNYCEKLPI